MPDNNLHKLESDKNIKTNSDDSSSDLNKDDNLDWAKRAYAKLKEEQEQKKLEREEDKLQENLLIKAEKKQTSEINAVDTTDRSNNVLLTNKKEEKYQSNDQDLIIEDVPSLGEFDQSFTWSAEVLAAQGKKVDDISIDQIDWLNKLKNGLEKTRQGFVTDLLEKFGDDPLTPEDLDDLEMLLLRADAGILATDQIINSLRTRLNQEVVDSKEAFRFLKERLCAIVDSPIKDSGKEILSPEKGCLNVWLLVGVNGVGKTTTLGKLANLALLSGFKSLIAAADTFRAAAVQQVKVWANRSGVEVIANETPNADPAAVVFDAIGAAKSKGIELLLVDTAGRLQTKNNLMEELTKVRKIIDKLAPEAKVESLLVLDASQGQNGLRQAMAFSESANLTGVVITKLDGSSRGGVAFAVSSQANLPIRFIGAGEGIRDLRPFNSFEFVEALLANN